MQRRENATEQGPPLSAAVDYSSCEQRLIPIVCENPLVMSFTPLQGQYLAFIHAYLKVNGRAPAEADLQRHFRVTPPTVHQMILTLERNGFISRRPGEARTIQLLLPPSDLPILE
jgi:repressor LexA